MVREQRSETSSMGQTVSEAFCVKIVGREKKIPCKYKAEKNWLAFPFC